MSKETDRARRNNSISYQITGTSKLYNKPVGSEVDLYDVLNMTDTVQALTEYVERLNALRPRRGINIVKRKLQVKMEDATISTEVLSLKTGKFNAGTPTYMIQPSRNIKKLFDFILAQGREQHYFNKDMSGDKVIHVSFRLDELVYAGWYTNNDSARKAILKAGEALKCFGITDEKMGYVQFFPTLYVNNSICYIQFNADIQWYKLMEYAAPTPLWVFSQTSPKEYDLMKYILRQIQVKVMVDYNRIKKTEKDPYTAIDKILDSENKYTFTIELKTIRTIALNLPSTGTDDKKNTSLYNHRVELVEGAICSAIKELNKKSEENKTGITLSIQERLKGQKVEAWINDGKLTVSADRKYVEAVIEAVVGKLAE